MSVTSPSTTVCRIAARSGHGELGTAMREATDAPIRPVGPTGVDALEPLLLVSREGRTAFFTACTPPEARSAARELGDGLPADAADAVVDHDAGTETLPVPEGSPLGLGARSVLGRCGWVQPADPDEYRSAGGFDSLSAGADDVLAAARSVTGRGWGDAIADTAIGGVWEDVAAASDTPAIVVNAHGSPGDTLLFESVPFLPLEGALAAADAVDADRVVVYLSEAAIRARERISEAVEALEDGGRPVEVEVEVVTGPDEHRAAEPTMALEAIEGSDRLEARLRPPGPAAEGLHGRPTLIHTPRTLAQVVRALAGADPTRIVTVRGDETATVELPEGASLSAVRDVVTVEGEFKTACVGGRFGGLTPDLDVAASPDALKAAGLGTEGVIDLLGEDRCVVAYVGEKARYGKAENCGRCVPCREGSTQLTSLLREVYDGSFRPDGIEELLRVMRSTSICDFGRDLTRPVATALEHFEREFTAHAAGRCPAGVCSADHPQEVSV